jgi:FAD/FMN-containing dehydrogenase
MTVQVSRRHFLATGAAATAAVSTGWADAFAAPPREALPPLPDAAWRQLAQVMRGAVLRPADSTFAAAARPDNLRYAGTLPAGIAQCLDAGDVAAAIKWCGEYRLPLIARAGGHSYAGFSTTEGLMIDVRAMKGTRYDVATQQVTVEGGALNSDVYTALRAAKRTITHGRCPTVGAAAFLLGGGIGFNMRRNGVASDSMLATDIVLADGTRKTGLNARSEKDDAALFWACRGGGGGNFGINTSFTLATIPADPVTVFKIIWKDADVDLGEAVMQCLHAATNALGSRVSFQAVNGSVTVDLLGQLHGSRDELLAILAPAFRLALPNDVKIEDRIDYWDAQDFLHEDGFPTYYQERSAYVHDQFDPKALAEGFAWLRRAPNTGGTCDLRFFQTGGVINDTPAHATAFVHRDNHWLMVVGLYWDAQTNNDKPLLDRAHDWQNGFYAAMLPATDRRSYQNFPDPSLDDWRKAYYGENYDDLSRIKKTVDPDRIFNFAQAV